MDEMNIGTGFMQTLLVKILKKVIKEKTGYYPEIQINDPIKVSFDGEKLKMHLDLDVELRKEDLQDIVKNLV